MVRTEWVSVLKAEWRGVRRSAATLTRERFFMIEELLEVKGTVPFGAQEAPLFCKEFVQRNDTSHLQIPALKDNRP